MGVIEKELRLNTVMEQVPTNLAVDKSACELRDSVNQIELKMEITKTVDEAADVTLRKAPLRKQYTDAISETKIQLSFSVDRLLSSGDEQQKHFCEMDIVGSNIKINGKCSGNTRNGYSCCTYPQCLGGDFPPPQTVLSLKTYQNSRLPASLSNELQNKMFTEHTSSLVQPPYLDFKSIVRPTPLRAIGGTSCESVPLHSPYSTVPSLLRFQPQKSPNMTHAQMLSMSPPTMLSFGGQHSLKALHGQQFGMPNYPHLTLSQRYPTAPMKSHHQQLIDMSTTLLQHHQHQQQQHHQGALSLSPNHHTATPTQLQLAAASGSSGALSGSGLSISNNSSGNTSAANSANGNSSNSNGGKRKRSWSRAVFSNLQRKGLEIQFQQQKYITKPDRRKLAARLNLTDAQVKVWFQNRRMKWRHTRENLKSGQEKQVSTTGAATTTTNTTTTTTTGGHVSAECDKQLSALELRTDLDDYSSDDSSSIELSENEDEIDVVE